MNNSPRIVFMGTPEFAVGTLNELVENDYNVVAVITAPDKPAGRGQKLRASAVKEYAVSKNIPVLQPVNLKDEAFLDELKSYEADLQIVVAFRMLPEVVWDMPKMKTFNLHASLLPNYRGAAPINWAIMNGDKKTGVTTFFIQHEIDTGHIIAQQELDITPNMNIGELYEELMQIGAKLVTKSVDEIAAGAVVPFKQDESLPMNAAPKIFKDDCRINWSKTGLEVHNHARGLNPYPAAWSVLSNGDKDINVKVFSTLLGDECDAPAGTVKQDGNKALYVATGTHWIQILELQLAGKRKMITTDLLCGFKFEGYSFV